MGGNTYKLGFRDGSQAERKKIIDLIQERICIHKCQHAICLDAILIMKMLRNGA
jgi:hypothetical protein